MRKMTEKRFNPLEEEVQLDWDGHGGGCCGITHISAFPDLDDYRGDDVYRTPTVAEKTAFILKGVSGSSRHCYEIVLIDSQIKQWGSAVKAAGFRRVSRFLNGGTGNYCNVFHKKTGQLK
jgi:hypothetical protein